MPNIRIYAEDHKRMVQLKGEMMAQRKQDVDFADVQKFLLDFYEQNKKKEQK